MGAQLPLTSLPIRKSPFGTLFQIPCLGLYLSHGLRWTGRNVAAGINIQGFLRGLFYTKDNNDLLRSSETGKTRNFEREVQCTIGGILCV